MFRKVVSLSVLALSVGVLASACSGSGGGAGGPSRPPLKPLSVEETARFKEAVSSLGDVTNLGAEFATAKTQGPRPRPALSLVAPTNKSKLKDVIDQSNCTKTMKLPEDQPPLKAGDTVIYMFSYDVSGPGCPLRYHAEMTGQQFYDAQGQPNGLKAVLKYEYQALSQEALDAADVDRLNLRGDMDVRMVITPDGTQTVTFTLDFGGDGHSQKEGDFRLSDRFDGLINVKITGQPQSSASLSSNPPPEDGGISFPGLEISGQMNETMLFVFKDMAAELTAKVKMQGFGQEADFRINGQVVTQQEYDEVRKSLNVPGMDDENSKTQPGPNPGPGPGPMTLLACEGRIYDSSDIDVGTLKSDMDAGREPAVQARWANRSCSVFGPKEEFKFPETNDTFTFTYDYTNAAFAKVDVSVCSNATPTACSRVTRSFLADEAKTFVDNVGAFVVMTRCEPKTSCF